jgi:uncharacterized protein
MNRPTIDAAEFAREGRQLRGSLQVGSLDRLAGQVLDGVVEFTLMGGSDRRGPVLDLSISGELKLACQRCLEPMPWRCEVSSRLRLVLPGQPWPDEALEDDESDAIEAEQALDVYGLVEEEILLAMPLAPRHEGCDSPGKPVSAGEKSPFAALAAIKRGSGKV